MSKYKTWYDAIILRSRMRKIDCYCEWHHVLPKSIGGPDSEENLVCLTYREHFLVHWLLTKIYTTGRAHYAMVAAIHAMAMPLGGRVIVGWQLDASKRLVKDAALERAKERLRFLERRRRQVLQDRDSLVRGRQEAIKLAESILSIPMVVSPPVNQPRPPKKPRWRRARHGPREQPEMLPNTQMNATA